MDDKKKQKLIVIIFSLIVFLCLIISIPSLAKLKNRNTIIGAPTWDGTVANSYKKGDGTIDDPYIISNGSEFAFFIDQLKTTDYDKTYFELSNDIIINPGIFDYNEIDGLKYILNDKTYYIKEYTNEYYENSNKEGSPIGLINEMSLIKKFKGNLNAKSFTIFGLYISSNTEENIALFENLEGVIEDLYITNSISYGNGNVAGIAINSNNAVLKNVLYDGFVINKGLLKSQENNLETIYIEASTLESTTILNLPLLSIDGAIKSIKLIGEYKTSNVDSINNIKINGIDITNNNFEIDLGTNVLNEVPIVVSSNLDNELIELFNLTYKIEYCDDITSGIVANSMNTKLNNVINKSDIYGNYISSGFVGNVIEKLEIVQGYNMGNVKSNFIASGIVGIVKNNTDIIEITNVYNKGTITSPTSGSIISIAQNNTGAININNSINASMVYDINTIINSIVNIESSYTINEQSIYNGITTNNFRKTVIENLYMKEFLTVALYNEFISFNDIKNNSTNAWIYEKNSLPILYIDDLNNPIAAINLSKYSWNNLSAELNTLNVTSNITFSINGLSDTDPIKEKYYYISNSKIALTEEQLNNVTEWNQYKDIVKIEESGYYVIYAKIIDANDDVTYINTDVIALDSSGFQTNITFDNHNWEVLKEEIDEIYVNKDINIIITAVDDLFGINSIEYYISNDKLTGEQLNDVTWIPYTNYIAITEHGSYIIYAKITNGEGNVKYLNTDKLLYNGYKETLTLGNISKNYDTNYITNKSLIKINFESDFEIMYKEGYTHNLISNILLPVGTKITLMDKNSNKIYQKIIDTESDIYGYNDSCDGLTNCSKIASYSFSLFKEIGTIDTIYYDESINYNKILTNEKYVITIDFSDTNLIDNYYDLSFFLAIKSSNNEFMYQTLNNTIKNINIYSKVNNNDILTTHLLTSDYTNQIINYNSNSELNINLTDIITYATINNKSIIDTNYENKKSGLLIKLYNQNEEEINGKYLDNMLFEVGSKEYFSDSTNSIRIDLGNIISASANTLKIKTKENNSDLENGTYYIKISKFISNDGYYYDSLYNDVIVIPLVVENSPKVNINYGFNVNILTDSIIINKKLDNHLVTFDIVYSGELQNPNIRVSLYEKKDLTAYNQVYKMVDLATYSSDAIDSIEPNKYVIDMSSTQFNLNLIPNQFNNNGYKYVFELYDGLNKISEIEKYFIVR